MVEIQAREHELIAEGLGLLVEDRAEMLKHGALDEVERHSQRANDTREAGSLAA